MHLLIHWDKLAVADAMQQESESALPENTLNIYIIFSVTISIHINAYIRFIHRRNASQKTETYEWLCARTTYELCHFMKINVCSLSWCRHTVSLAQNDRQLREDRDFENSVCVCGV